MVRPKNDGEGLIDFLCSVQSARKSFWDYCNVTSPEFYTPQRTFLKFICDELQAFSEDDTNVLILNLPPRHGKSRTACKFVEWLFGKYPLTKIMTGSYNEILSTNFSASVRDSISQLKTDAYRIVYSDIFPNTKIKRGDSAKNIWSLEGSDVKSYLATSPTGTATGFGAEYIIIDDLIKSAQEALNPTVLSKHWDWFTNTMYSRLEGRRKLLIVMTQWATQDLAHRAKEHFSAIGLKVKQICINACGKDGKMLDEEILPLSAYHALQKTLAPVIFEANYNNRAVDMIDGVYGTFKTYQLHELPAEYDYVISQTDTADEGADYLCKITARRVKNLLYVEDVYYTQARMEITERECAKRTEKFRVNYDRYESNNGGKGFARSVERIYRENGGTLADFKWRATTTNKEARILSGATGVTNTVVMPSDWAIRWPEFYNAVTLYSRTGKNEHDDAPDCLTRLYEEEFEKPKYAFGGGIGAIR